MKRAWQLAVLVALAGTLASAETGINTVVQLVESRYAVRHQGIPGLWLAKPFMMGSGAGGLKMATFEDFGVPAKDVAALKEEVRRALGPEWLPFVETWSNADSEWSVIYVRPNGHSMKMLIVTGERDEFSVMQMHVSGKARDGWFNKPVKTAKHQTAGNKTGGDQATFTAQGTFSAAC